MFEYVFEIVHLLLLQTPLFPWNRGNSLITPLLYFLENLVLWVSLTLILSNFFPRLFDTIWPQSSNRFASYPHTSFISKNWLKIDIELFWKTVWALLLFKLILDRCWLSPSSLESLSFFVLLRNLVFNAFYVESVATVIQGQFFIKRINKWLIVIFIIWLVLLFLAELV